MERNGPWTSRHCTMRAAIAGPTLGSRSSSLAVALLTLTTSGAAMVPYRALGFGSCRGELESVTGAAEVMVFVVRGGREVRGRTGRAARAESTASS